MADGARPASPARLAGPLAAVKELRQLQRVGGSPQWRHIGVARAVAEHGPGWFEVTISGHTIDLDTADVCLAPRSGPGEQSFQPIEAYVEQSVVRIRAAEFAPTEGLSLWVKRGDPQLLLDSLTDEINKLRRTAITEAFLRSKLSETPASPADVPGMNEAQRLAVAACCTPGLRLVWGPPGTGKTKVIATALEKLIEMGKSVLVVSGTNVAVDNALTGVVNRIAPRPGLLVRAGRPHMARIAADARVNLQLMTTARLADMEGERQQLVGRIAQLGADPVIAELDRAQLRLKDFDHLRYAAIELKVATAMELALCEAELGNAQVKLSDLREHLAAGQDQAGAAEQAWVAAEAARLLFEQADAAKAELAECHMQADRVSTRAIQARADHAAAGTAVAEAMARPLFTRLLDGGKVRRVHQAHLAASSALQVAENDQLEMRRILGRVEERLSQALSRCAAEAGMTRDELDACRSWTVEARDAVVQTLADIRSLELDETRLAGRFRHLQGLPQPSPQEADYYADSRANGLAQLHLRVPTLQAAATKISHELRTAEVAHEKLLTQIRKYARDAERQIIQAATVVATTLAMARMKPAIRDRVFDVVIIDEAAFSARAEVLAALGRAESTAVLLGDFMQNTPFASELSKPSEDARQWLLTDVFTPFGVDGTKPVNGCVILTDQYRFGPSIMRLANDVAYRGRLRAGISKHDQIIVVDVDGLGDSLAGLQYEGKSGGTKTPTWAVGPLLARALAEHHLTADGETAVGVVTPYKSHASTITDFLDDIQAGQRTEVGTVHRFQGREFGVVILDTVEGGSNWLSQSALSASRVFNVAVTRAQHTLYIIVSGPVLQRIRSGPLRHLKSMIDEGLVPVVRAAAILTTLEEPAPDGPLAEVWQALRAYVKVTDIYDEASLPEALRKHIANAERSIWLWSPWVAKRIEEFAPALRAAVDNGVEVRVMMLPNEELNEQMVSYAEQLVRTGAKVLRIRHEHQKIAVIDGQYTFIGSMNVLSHQKHGGRRETMLLMESRSFAQEILRHERADQLAGTPSCQQCGSQLEVDLRGRGKDRRLHWVCVTRDHEQQPFPDMAGTRNQPPT